MRYRFVKQLRSTTWPQEATALTAKTPAHSAYIRGIAPLLLTADRRVIDVAEQDGRVLEKTQRPEPEAFPERWHALAAPPAAATYRSRRKPHHVCTQGAHGAGFCHILLWCGGLTQVASVQGWHMWKESDMRATMELADVIIVNYGLHYQVRADCV